MKLAFKEVSQEKYQVLNSTDGMFFQTCYEVKFHYLDAENARNSDRTSYPF